MILRAGLSLVAILMLSACAAPPSPRVTPVADEALTFVTTPDCAPGTVTIGFAGDRMRMTTASPDTDSTPAKVGLPSSRSS